MLEPLFFGLGIANSVLLILVFVARVVRMEALKRFGWVYLLLGIPAIFSIVVASIESKSVRYSIFLGIFLAFLAMEFAYDFILKVDFRQNWKRNWKLLTPYLALYWAMNYGFVTMVWKTSLPGGLFMLGLFVVQIAANVATHPKQTKPQVLNSRPEKDQNST